MGLSRNHNHQQTTVFKHRVSTKGFFLTEIGAQTQPKRLDERGKTFSGDLYMEIRGMVKWAQAGNTDLAELRKRIAKCGRDIDAQRIKTQKITKSLKSINSNYEGLVEKFKTIEHSNLLPGS